MAPPRFSPFGPTLSLPHSLPVWSVRGHRVGPPRFGKAALELGARAVEEQGRDVAAAAFAQFLDPPHEQRGAETAAAAVDADGERTPRLAGFDGRVDQRFEQREGEVVDNLDRKSTRLNSSH